MEYTELNHYSRLPIDKFIDYLGFELKPIDGKVNWADTLLEYPITEQGKIIPFIVDGKDYWIDEQEWNIHMDTLNEFKDTLCKYSFGYILGTSAPYQARGLASATNRAGYVLWIAPSYSYSIVNLN